jgi:transposase-like protein
MMKVVRYSPEEKEWAIQQMMPPLSRFVVELSRATGITTVTLRTWKKAARAEGRLMPANGTNDRWSGADKFRMVLETAPLSENELSEYCRRQGVFPEQISQWRAACEEANQAGMQAGNKVQAKRIRELESMLKRKDAKLIEAEALLALEKKLEAIWGKGKAG